MTKQTAPPWFRSRGYAHFDVPMALADAEQLCCSPDEVAAHAFWPVILRPQSVVRKAALPDGRRHWKQKTRPIGYVSHSDAHVQAHYAWLINERLEQRYASSAVHECVTAYRKLDGKCNVDFAKEMFDLIDSHGPCDVVTMDVSGFFDSLDHTHLKASWSSLLGVGRLPNDHFAVYRSATRDSAITVPTLRDLLGGQVPRRAGRGRQRICPPSTFRSKVVPHLRPRFELVANVKSKPVPTFPKGITQGTPISAVLANLYMWDADCVLHDWVQDIGGTYRRYSDDILVIVPTGGALGAVSRVISTLKQEGHGLSAEPTKTSVLRFRQGTLGLECERVDEHGIPSGRGRLDYLGLSYDGRSIRIRDSSVGRFLIRMSGAVRRARIAASKAGTTKINRRKLYAALSPLGWGSAYGDWDECGAPPPSVPRMGFHKYLKLAAARTQSEAVMKQARQLENALYRKIAAAEKALATACAS